jgi:hypothetical protein
VPGNFFKVLDPTDVLDGYSVTRNNIAYQAGEVYHLRSDTKFIRILLGCYRHPDITQATFSSWIALDHPYVIVYDAAMSLLHSIGFNEEAQRLKSVRDEYFLEMKNSNILGAGE